MTDTTPIACSLTGSDYGRRTEDIGRFARAALRDRTPIHGGVRLTFDPVARERLQALVAAESECCPFLAMDLQASDGRLVLDVTGPRTAAPVIAELFAG
jgi:hypothetical protein